MATFDPFDKKAASVQAARDRDVADRAKKMQAEADARRKKQLLQGDIAKLEQEIARRTQESGTLSLDIEKITREIEQKKREASDLDRSIQQVEKKIPEEDKKLKLGTQILQKIGDTLRSLKTKLSSTSSQEKKEDESVQNKKALVATTKQKKEILANESARLETLLTKLKSDADKGKKDLVQKQTVVINIEREQQVLEQKVQTSNSKIRELERQLQAEKALQATQIQEKARVDGEHAKDAQQVQILLQETQSKDSEIYRVAQEVERVHRDLNLQKDTLERLETTLTQEEGLEKRDEAEIVRMEQEEQKLEQEEKEKRGEVDQARREYESDSNTLRGLQTKKLDALSHVSNQSSILQQRQQRLRVLDGELKKFEAELQQKQREMQQVKF